MIPCQRDVAERAEPAPILLPFLKWPGGKRWAAGQIAAMVRRHLIHAYYEPFLGGGAVFFSLQPKRAMLSDVNGDLINTYRVVRDSVGQVISRLRGLPVDKCTYNRLRADEPVDRIERAVRFLYLNRTAFAGMYRLNLNGKFNVPFGGGERTPEILWATPLLRAASSVLSTASIRRSDFEPILDRAMRGDVVYCDPTYTVAHDCNGFIRYNERNFSWEDQVRLARAARRASRRGAKVVVTNANHPTVRELYSGARFQVLHRRSLVSTDVSKRRDVDELLVCL
jgi:DNA adenine methylase